MRELGLLIASLPIVRNNIIWNSFFFVPLILDLFFQNRFEHRFQLFVLKLEEIDYFFLHDGGILEMALQWFYSLDSSIGDLANLL